MHWSLEPGDALTVLQTLPSQSVQCCVTSPPYWGLRDYGCEGQLGLEATPDAYVAALVAVFAEVKRVLADDGVLWLNLGDSYAANNWVGNRADATSGLNCIRPGYVPPYHAGVLDTREQKKIVPAGLKPKDLVGIPWRVAFALQADGWYLRSDVIWAKPNPMPESVTDRPTKAHEYVFLLSKSARYYYDADAIREPYQDVNHPVGSDGKFINPKSAGGVSSHQWSPPVGSRFITTPLKRHYNPAGRNARSVWTINTDPYPDAHFAVMPEDLATRCVLAGSRHGDTILDPFAGAGTTGVAALGNGRSFLGIELNPDYCTLAAQRLDSVAPLFAVHTPFTEVSA